MIDLTGNRLFFQLLKWGRFAKGIGATYEIRRAYLGGMRTCMQQNLEDFTVADDMRDYWKCQNSGAA